MSEFTIVELTKGRCHSCDEESPILAKTKTAFSDPDEGVRVACSELCEWCLFYLFQKELKFGHRHVFEDLLWQESKHSREKGV